MPQVKPSPLKPKYSGHLSRKFWKLINSVPYSEGGRELYTMGCILQDVEGRILRALAEKVKNAKA